MMVTFPHMGPMSIIVGQLFGYLKIPYIISSGNRREDLIRGAAISPEEMCLPFKYMAGNLLWAYEKGADTAVMISTCGPCRLGEYGELLKMVLESAGCRYRWVLSNSSDASDKGHASGKKHSSGGLVAFLREQSIPYRRIFQGVVMAVILSFRMDRLRDSITLSGAYLRRPYEAVRLMRNTDTLLKKSRSFKECYKIINNAGGQLKLLERNPDASPVEIMVVGEIYTSIESEANGHLEEKLMELGCSVRKHMKISWWILHTLWKKGTSQALPEKRFRREGLCCTVGGYGKETVARILKEKKADGIIKIMPSGCMPEIVTKGFCQGAEEKIGKPVMHLVYDALGANTGYETRIEAFVDMLERRRYVLDGNRRRLHKY